MLLLFFSYRGARFFSHWSQTGYMVQIIMVVIALARGSEFVSQHPHNNPGMAVHTSVSTVLQGEERRGLLWLAGPHHNSMMSMRLCLKTVRQRVREWAS